MFAIPDKKLNPLMAMYDDHDHIMKSEFALRVEGNTEVHLDNYFTANNSTHAFGAPNKTAKLVLSTPQNLYGVENYIEINIIITLSTGGFLQ